MPGKVLEVVMAAAMRSCCDALLVLGDEDENVLCARGWQNRTGGCSRGEAVEKVRSWLHMKQLIRVWINMISAVKKGFLGAALP